MPMGYYGVMDAELDVIVNYNIKYRLGGGATITTRSRTSMKAARR